MDKPIYLFAVIFLSLAVIAGIINCLLWFQIGYQVMTMPSFLAWFCFTGTVAIIANLFLLYYFYSRGWKFIFITGAMVVILILVLSIFQYTRLVEVQNEPGIYQKIVWISYLILGVVTGLAIALTAARREKLLRASGCLILLMGLAHLIFAYPIVFKLSPAFVMNGIAWINFMSNIISILYILHFIREMRGLSLPERPRLSQQSFYYTAGISAMFLLVFVVSTGFQLSMETGGTLDSKKNARAYSETLAKRFESRIFIGSNGDTLRYYFMQPIDYDTTRLYPLVTCLHGGYIGTGDVAIATPAPYLSDPSNRQKFAAFLFVPQVSVGHTWGWVASLPGMDTLVFEAIASLEKDFHIDTDRRYISGVSGGGYGTWHYITTHPDFFAAAIPICGVGDPGSAGKIANLPLWAFHGEKDRNVPVSGSRNIIKAMRQAGGEPKYSEFPGVGHDVWPEVVSTPGVFEWMFGQSRK